MLVWPGDAPVCDPKTFYECLQPRLAEYVRDNEATKCNCPRQCCRLSYDYTVSQAQFSDFQISFSKEALKLNYTLDQLRNDMCTLEVTITAL